MAAILLMAAIGAWAVMTDRISYVITHGVSMNPTYYQDDLVLLVKRDSYEVGQIAAYRGPGAGEDVLHRIIGGDAAGYVFKGDNNESIDTTKPTDDQIIGCAVLHVPHGGIWLKPLLSPTGLGMIGFLVVGGGTAAARSRREIPRGRRKKKVKAMARQGGSGAAAMAAFKLLKQMSPMLRVAAMCVAVAAASAIALGVLGWMKPIRTLTSATLGTGQSVTFAYSAAVPRSPAYDSTMVTSPDPIFRRLAKRVDVHLSYQGPPGIMTVTTTLTNGSGWHTVMPAMPKERLSGNGEKTTVTMDLDAIDGRAKAATDVIGLSPSPVSIVIRATVEASGAPEFIAPLGLSLTPLQLTLAAGSETLTVRESSSAAPAKIMDRQISAFGLDLFTAASARSYAILLLIAAAAGAALIAWVSRRGISVRTRAEIERRYPQLLVHVEPMQSPPGKPVVNVDNFPALVKLAERYGQMILTWRRPDADDFVVRDEGITYRYRVELDQPALLHNVEQIDRPSAGSHRRNAPTQVS